MKRFSKIWQGKHLGLKIFKHTSIASRTQRGIVKLKLEHPCLFRSLKMDKKYGIYKLWGVEA